MINNKNTNGLEVNGSLQNKNKQFLFVASVVNIATACLYTAKVFVLIFLLNLDIEFPLYENGSLNSYIYIALGLFGFFLLTLYAVYFFRSSLSKNDRANLGLREFILIYTILGIQIIFTLIAISISVYAITFAFVPLMLVALIDKKTAYFINAISAVIVYMLVSVIAPSVINLGFVAVMGFVCGTILIYFVSTYMPKVKYVYIAGIGVVLAGVVAVLSAAMFGVSQDLFIDVGIGIGTEVLAMLIFMTLLPLFEALFNIATDYRLVEITNHNAPLIKRLSKEAPGTFQHSITVANLAEACASAIGENAFLARAAAYYHDIGKILNPEYFTENQHDGVNIHDSLTPEQSVSIIRKHAVDGYDLCKQNRIPENVARMTLEHHGTTVVKYFYDRAKSLTENELPTRNYSYNGYKPSSKIAAILMIVDSSEAAVKSLGNAQSEQCERIIDGIISARMAAGQFDECPITMQDLATIKDTLLSMFVGIRHERVKYDN
ncbi:MAG: HDIG domain-containing protein [Firmicutes bacterium]|nr:HDIG domain-containing protein [Bacillota bacterium]